MQNLYSKDGRNYQTENWSSGYGKVIWKRKDSYVNDPACITDGKVAIITGGSSGIGMATALALAKEGVKIVVVAARRAKMEKKRDHQKEEIRCERAVVKDEEPCQFV